MRSNTMEDSKNVGQEAPLLQEGNISEGCKVPSAITNTVVIDVGTFGGTGGMCP